MGPVHNKARQQLDKKSFKLKINWLIFKKLNSKAMKTIKNQLKTSKCLQLFMPLLPLWEGTKTCLYSTFYAVRKRTTNRDNKQRFN